MEPSARDLPLRVLRFNGTIRAARVSASGQVEISYTASSRAIAVTDRPVGRLELDGVEEPPVLAGPTTLVLPRGQHVVTLQAMGEALAQRSQH